MIRGGMRREIWRDVEELGATAGLDWAEAGFCGNLTESGGLRLVGFRPT
jgi:hypothetical protein